MKTKLKLIAALCCTFLTFGAVADDVLRFPGKVEPTVQFCKEYSQAVYRIAKARNVNTLEEVVDLIQSVDAQPRMETLMIKSAAYVYQMNFITAKEHQRVSFNQCLQELL